MLKIAIVDDEPLARDRLRLLVEEIDNSIEIVGEAENGKEALKIVKEQSPDVILLDIQMPVLDGFDVVGMMGKNRPAIVFTTAYEEFALKAFEVHAVDYLLKPIRKKRLKQALDRVQEPDYRTQQVDSVEALLGEVQQKRKNTLQKIPVVYKTDILLIDYDDIIYIEADGKISWVYLENKRYRTDFSLQELESRLENQSFLRIHRSHIINLEHVDKIEPWYKSGYRLIMSNGKELDVARRRVADLKERLGM